MPFFSWIRFFLCLQAVAFGVSPHASAEKTLIPEILTQIEKKYSQGRTLTADFQQITENATLGSKKISSGKLYYKRPSKIRWETTQPDSQLLVSDGKTYWFYTPPFDEGENGQLIQKKKTEVQSQLADAILTGSFSQIKNIKVSAQGKSRFLIIPKAGTAGTVQKILLEVLPQEKLIQKVAILHQGGNHSEITLSHVHVGEPLEDKLFHFNAPKNTDLIKD